MTENAPSFKSFNQPGSPASALPPLLAKLAASHELFRNLDAHDLREMSKFTELPNIEGLAAQRVERPAPPELNPETHPGPAELPMPVMEALGRELKSNPCIMVTGALGGACARPVRVAAIVPQSHGHLAQALQRMLWPAEGAAPLDVTLFIWPDVLRRRAMGHCSSPSASEGLPALAADWPAEKTGIIIGFDDPALPARMLAAAARRIWATELPQAHIAQKDEEFLIESDGPKPLWANPLFPARVLAQRTDLRAAALAVGALPLGVAVDAEGRFPLLHGTEDEIRARLEYEESVSGWIIVPRRVLPVLPAR